MILERNGGIVGRDEGGVMYHVKSREIGFGLSGDEEGVEGLS